VSAAHSVLVVADCDRDAIEVLLGRYGLTLVLQDDGEAIAGSFWGEREAGIVGHTVYVRSDTPIHSLLHETCHVICMDGERRRGLDRDAGGDDMEETAVCYLQVVLADHLDGVGRERLMADMDAWGYSFRLGSTSRWLNEDADDARAWLLAHGLLTESGQPVYSLRN
jgi:hypothetical protein